MIYEYAIGGRDIPVHIMGNAILFGQKDLYIMRASIEHVALLYTCRQTRLETKGMPFRLNTFHGHLRDLPYFEITYFLSHRNTPKDEIRSICLDLHTLRIFDQVDDRDDRCARLRASIKALSNLKEVEILLHREVKWKKQKFSAAEVDHLKRIFGLDKEGLVLKLPE